MRLFKKINDFGKFQFGSLASRHILKGYVGVGMEIEGGFHSCHGQWRRGDGAFSEQEKEGGEEGEGKQEFSKYGRDKVLGRSGKFVVGRDANIDVMIGEST